MYARGHALPLPLSDGMRKSIFDIISFEIHCVFENVQQILFFKNYYIRLLKFLL